MPPKRKTIQQSYDATKKRYDKLAGKTLVELTMKELKEAFKLKDRLDSLSKELEKTKS